MSSIVITLIIVAFVLFFVEIFTPGGILASFGAMSLFSAAVLAYPDLGILGSAGILIGGTILGFGMFFLELRLLEKSPFAKQFIHSNRQTAQTQPIGSPDLVGKTGLALTTMAPSGKVKVENEIFEAASLGGLINKNATVEVVRSEHLKLVVKEI
jgi:membrane-bound serine protease (ClpP class)